MKTSILISSLAAFCLMIAVAEPGHHTSINSKDSCINQQKSAPAGKTPFFKEKKEPLLLQNQNIHLVPSTLKEDFNYLKFRVDKYSISETSSGLGILPIMPEPDYSYLKFDVGKYTSDGNKDHNIPEELPVAETLPPSFTATL
jgi:hypothetical protein